MKRIIIKFISIYAEKMGRERVIEVDDNTTIEDLERMILEELGETRMKPVFFVNYRFPSKGQILRDGDEILVMPPFAGG
ncbi:MAG: MoaD/ThiS family protein [Sulfolobales archaeon]